MGFVIYGRKRTAIDVGEALIKCPSCESHKWADIMVYSVYYHLYWIPMFPYEKDVDIICGDCGLKQYGMIFEQPLIGNFEEIRRRFRHPWYTYIGIGVFVMIVIAAVIASIGK